VEERRLGPVVGLGTWNTFHGDAILAREVVGAALGAGCKVVDSSPMYGAAERTLGVALDSRRGSAVVATKVWADSVKEARAQFADQVEWFGRIEIEQVHNLVAWREHLEWLEPERDSGRIERLGVTHWQAGAFEELARALRTGRFQTLQVPLNPFERECERELIPLAQELDTAAIVMRPLGRKDQLPHPPAAEKLASLAEFGIESWPQALLKWALSDARVDVVIPPTKNPAHARENARAGEPPWFGAEERVYVERLATA
jgi:diketogulonate reductase-like aldo/keto reductase